MSDRCAIVCGGIAESVLPPAGRSRTRAGTDSRRCPDLLVPSLTVALETPTFQAYRGAEPPRFANEAELEYAKILDFYGVPWMYEPNTFVLERDEDGRV